MLSILDGYLSCFQFGVILYTAAMNIPIVLHGCVFNFLKCNAILTLPRLRSNFTGSKGSQTTPVCNQLTTNSGFPLTSHGNFLE